MAVKRKTAAAISSIDMTNILAHAHARAKEILDAISNNERLPYFGHLSKLLNSEPADIWTILAIISSTTSETKIDAKKVLGEIQSSNASKARTDLLQNLIINIVKGNPSLKVSGLKKELKKQIGQGVITDIQDGQIEWDNKHGLPENTPVTGLKDRLFRAKLKNKKIAATG